MPLIFKQVSQNILVFNKIYILIIQYFLLYIEYKNIYNKAKEFVYCPIWKMLLPHLLRKLYITYKGAIPRPAHSHFEGVEIFLYV